MVGKLERVTDLREIWKREAKDFTSWLAENCDVLKDQLGIELAVIDTEKAVGPFSVDILAKDAEGRIVIIENQLERTDHDHLGKVLTYLTNLEAKIAIWISSDPRPEHVNAIDFLNQYMPSDTQFYLVKLEAFRIGGSDAAPLFTVEAGPSEERTAGGEIKKEVAKEGRELGKRRYKFFEQLLDRCNKKTRLFNNISPVDYQGWVSTGAGKSGLIWALVVMQTTSRIDLTFTDSDPEVNKKRFEEMFSYKEDIEKNFGEPLIWDFKEGRKQHYIKYKCPLGGLEDESEWQAIQEDLINRLIKLEAAVHMIIRGMK